MINTRKFSAACMLTTAILWIGCSALVVVMPETMWQMTGQMIHVELQQTSWSMSGPGFFSGLLCWSALAGLTGAVLAAIYNRLLGPNAREVNV
jgi:2TM family of unknown function (DUF5676)